MKIEFIKVIIHNFLSFGHGEIELNNKGYCLVNGINNCPLDNARSNGAGKTTLISAICWALTGETSQGVKSNIKNIYIDDDSCYVELFFKIDDISYEVKRINKPKSDLKIKVNNEDKSGKGIKESEIILTQYLPDLNKDLLTSIILLGQGLPNKLSSHSPSGRKEMLEKLSKSDFMIEDIKSRITTRLSELNTKIRLEEDKLVSYNTKLTIYSNELDKYIKEQENYIEIDYTSLINESEILINQLNAEIFTLSSEIDTLNTSLDKNTRSLLDVVEQKKNELNEELGYYTNKREEIISIIATTKSNINLLKQEITRLESIKDICPTCGQKLLNVIKSDTTNERNKLQSLEQKLNNSNSLLENCIKKHNEYVKEINDDYSQQINDFNSSISNIRNEISSKKSILNSKNSSLASENNKLYNLKVSQSNEETKKQTLQDNINKYKELIDETTKNIDKTQITKTSTQEHLEVVKKMDTLVKRDFRGYLLSNIVDFINNKAKEYCKEVFGSDKIDFEVDGNNIDISYCNKPFESLSGGEKQKIDLILQFAIRDMMSQYLDFSSNILCLDEIFDNLDAQSTNSVLNLLTNKLNDIESLFIISHHSDELNIPSDTTINIVKDVNGISEVK